MNLVEYLPAIVAFLVAILAISGSKKWDAEKRGIKKLTRSGRITVLLATIALISSLFLVRRKQEELDLKRKSFAEVKSIAYKRIKSSLSVFSNPFREALWNICDDMPNQNGDTSYPINILNPAHRNALASLNLKSLSPAWSPESGDINWGNWFSYSAKQSDKQLLEAIDIYNSYIEPDVLIRIEEIRNSEFYWRVKDLDELIQANDHVDTLAFIYAETKPYSFGDVGYDDFWTNMIHLESLLSTK